LTNLNGSDKIIGDIASYCVNLYKSQPNGDSLKAIENYVSDTANSVTEHILKISDNLSNILVSQANDIEQLNFQSNYISHRLQTHQLYTSELLMTKFQTCPRPRPTIHILRQSVANDDLPKYARRRGAWVREKEFNYKILDSYGAKNDKNENNAQQSVQPITMKTIPLDVAQKKLKENRDDPLNPTPAVMPFNPYEIPSVKAPTIPPPLFSNNSSARMNTVSNNNNNNNGNNDNNNGNSNNDEKENNNANEYKPPPIPFSSKPPPIPPIPKIPPISKTTNDEGENDNDDKVIPPPIPPIPKTGPPPMFSNSNNANNNVSVPPPMFSNANNNNVKAPPPPPPPNI